MQIHPFYTQNSSSYQNLPSQNLPSKKKNKKWREACMDALENHARIQFFQKQALIKNYKMVNGELVTEEYEPENEDKFLLNDLFDHVKKEGKSYEKHYDIISQPMSVLEGELDAFPDVFNVIARGDMIESERMKVRSEMLRQWFMYKQQQEIDKITQIQESPDDAFFATDEQQPTDEQEIPKAPKEIETYLETGYRHLIELWAQFELEDQFERFRIKALRREEFHHMLVSAERYRHIVLGPNGLTARTENPIMVSSHKSPTEKFVQNGDFASVVRLLSVPAVIDEFGHLMTDKQLSSLELPDSWEDREREAGLGTDMAGKKINYLSPYGVPYQTRVQTLNPMVSQIPSMKAVGSGAPGYFFTEEELTKIDGWGNFLSHKTYGLLVVLKSYWKSQLRVGKLTWINPETGIYEVIEVDDKFVVPDYIKEIKDERYNYVGQLNTIVWTRITQVWEGIKITNMTTDGFLKEPLYIDIKPADIQINKLLICGQFINNINTKPTSFVDRIKNLQFFYNVLMNEAFHFITTEWLPYTVVDGRDIPKDKDWGGEDGLEKWAESAQEGGVVPIDSSPENRQGSSNNGGQYPKVVDMDRSTRILTRLQVAAIIRQLALDLVGINEQRLGQTKATETATGIQQATTSSNTQTASWFSEFFECEKDILQTQLDAAKFLQARDGEFSVEIMKSDLTRQALKFSLEDGNLFDLHVYVTDNQDELRKLQIAQRLSLENNTSDINMSKRLEMSTDPSYRNILTVLKQSEEEALERQQQEFQLKQQELQQNGMAAEQALAQAERRFILEQQVKLQVATLTALGRQRESDVNGNGISDVIEYNKSIAMLQDKEIMNIYNNSKLNIERERDAMEASFKERELLDRREQRRHEKDMNKMDLQRDKVRGDKSK